MRAVVAQTGGAVGLAFGLGDWVEGIVLHQILQCHLVTRRTPDSRRLARLRPNANALLPFLGIGASLTLSAIGSLAWNSETASALLLVGVGLIWAVLAARVFTPESLAGGSDVPPSM